MGKDKWGGRHKKVDRRRRTEESTHHDEKVDPRRWPLEVGQEKVESIALFEKDIYIQRHAQETADTTCRTLLVLVLIITHVASGHILI